MGDRKYDRCSRCQEWGWVDAHKCPPIFECLMESDGDWRDLYEVYARDTEEAAEKFVGQYEDNSGCMKIACNEEEVIVLVRAANDREKVSRWEVRGWMSPLYSAELADEPEETTTSAEGVQ